MSRNKWEYLQQKIFSVKASGHGLYSKFILNFIYLTFISRGQNLCVCTVTTDKIRIRKKPTNSCFLLYVPMKQSFNENYICPPNYCKPHFLLLLHLLAMTVNLSHTSLTMLSINCLHNNNTVMLRFGPKKAQSQVGHRWNAKRVCLKKSEWGGECNTALKCQLLEMFNLGLCNAAGALTL